MNICLAIALHPGKTPPSPATKTFTLVETVYLGADPGIQVRGVTLSEEGVWGPTSISQWDQGKAMVGPWG
jgi:hypothetical protein